MSSFILGNNPYRNYYLGLCVFWAGVFILNTGPHWEIYSSTRELVETSGMKTGLQMFVAILTIRYLVPVFLEKEKWWQFIAALIFIIVIASEINILIRYLYLEQHYPDSYKQFLSLFSDMTLTQRMDLRWAIRYILFTKVPAFTFPTVLLVAYKFYQKQQILLKLKEQKISAELDALKNQLNPHFIFNTLNNIYALSLKKSDQTPIAIEKLSAILDYVVYRCNDKYVDLGAEISLIENYVALEKIRYGKRLQFSLDVALKSNLKIAPLILLTLLENACKHGIREELKQAHIHISLSESDDFLSIKVHNSKPARTSQHGDDTKQVGLDNLKKQLELLYPNAHSLDIQDESNSYTAALSLKIPSKAEGDKIEEPHKHD